MLDGVTTTLKEVQSFLSTILSSSTILIGHSLENDLRALKVHFILLFIIIIVILIKII